MVCPRCSSLKSRCVYTKQDGGVTQRIRKCRECHYSFNTVERPEIITFSESEKKEYENYLNEEN